MSNSQIGDNVPDQEQLRHRQQLISKIDQFKQKIADYQSLQREINEISMIVNEPKSSRNSNSKQLKSSKMPEGEAKHNQNLRRNTNKKIKIYDLRKKLDKLMAEQNEKKVLFYQNRQNHSKLEEVVQNINHQIEEQKKKAKSLVELQKRILNDLVVQEQKVTAQIYELQESVKKKQMFNFEKRKIRDQLRKIRTTIAKISNTRKSSSVLQLSLTQSRQQFELQVQKQILSQNSNGMNQTTLWIGRQKQRIQDFQSKIQIVRQKNGEMIDLFYNLKKKFSDNQILVKHHKITIKLQSNQLNNYNKLIEEAKAQIQINNQKKETVGNQLKQVEGERGYLRGKIGVIIQQQRLIKSINILAENDVESLRQKLSYLKNIKQMINSHK